MISLRLQIVVLIAATFIWHDSANAQNNHFSAFLINSTNGLSNNYVNDIYQDKIGFLWVATNDGLNRFDGYDYLVFRPDIYDSLSLSSEMIYAITEDTEHNIWVATNKGISKYDVLRNKFRNITFYDRILGSERNETYDLIFANDTLMYCLLNSKLVSYNPLRKTIREFVITRNGLPVDTRSGSLHYDPLHSVLLLGLGDGLFFLDKLNGEVLPLTDAPNRVFDIASDGAGLWIGNSDGLSRCYISETGIPEKCERILSGQRIRGVEISPNGDLILATLNKILRYSTSAKKILSDDYVNLIGYENIPNINDLFLDKSSNLWVGTNSGLAKTDMKPHKFSYFNEETNKHKLNAEMISSIYRSDDKIYLGSWGGGIQVIDLSTSESNFYSQGNPAQYFPERSVNLVFSDNKNRIWVGFTGLYMFDEKKGRFIPAKEVFDIPDARISESMIFDMIQLNDDEYVLAHRKGLYFINEAEKTFRNDTVLYIDSLSLPLIDITGIEKSEGKIWVGSSIGLICYELESGAHEFYPFERSNGISDRILCTKTDSQHRLWIGTPTGLFKFIKETGTFEGYSVKYGLANDYIYSIEEDNNGLLWLSTNKGIISFNPENHDIQNYGIQHGLSCLEFNINASYYNNDGLMYFGGINGLNFFNPDSAVLTETLPSTEITGIRYFGNGTQDYKPNVVSGFSFGINETVQLYFSLMDLGHPEYNIYKYRLRKGDKDAAWNLIGNENSLILSGLTYGKYKFDVLGANGNGEWSEIPARLSFEVKAPFYRRNIFTGMMFLPALLLIYFLFEYRTKTLRRSNRALREKEITAKQVLRQKNLLMRRNKNIEDSLKYAQRIQHAMFTSETEIRKMFPDSFILQKPKDIVSGDFYWGKQIENKIFLAAADCTGHGVPGAFMSLIGLEFFRQIILNKGIYKPSLILDEINTNFDIIFDNMDDLDMRDGMDLALISYDTETKVLQFSGAFNPLYIVRNGEIIEIKGDRNVLGPDLGFGRTPFINHEIKIEEHDVLYIFSDGYADQFGGPEGKKFKYRRFRHLLLSIYDKPLNIQRKILEDSILDWIGSKEQVDDILVVGFMPYNAVSIPPAAEIIHSANEQFSS